MTTSIGGEGEGVRGNRGVRVNGQTREIGTGGIKSLNPCNAEICPISLVCPSPRVGRSTSVFYPASTG